MNPTQLYDLEINEISLVKSGDDPEAKIIMTKMKKEAMKTEGGSEYPSEAYAYAPDLEQPSTWKLRLWESPDAKITPAQVGRAVAALGPGFRGEKVQIPDDEMDDVKNKVAAAFNEANPDRELPEILKKGTSEMYTAESLAGMAQEELIAIIVEMQGEKDTEEMVEDDMMKSIPESVQKSLDEKEAMLKEQSARIEKMEKEAIKKEMTLKADGYVVHGLTKEQITENLINAHSAGTLEMVEKAYEITTSTAKNSEMLKEVGAAGGDNSATELEKIESIAKEIRVSDPKLTKEQAFARAHQIMKKGK